MAGSGQKRKGSEWANVVGFASESGPSDLPDFNEYTPVKKLNACGQT
jgi:hypothetical protein